MTPQQIFDYSLVQNTRPKARPIEMSFRSLLGAVPGSSLGRFPAGRGQTVFFRVAEMACNLRSTCLLPFPLRPTRSRRRQCCHEKPHKRRRPRQEPRPREGSRLTRPQISGAYREPSVNRVMSFPRPYRDNRGKILLSREASAQDFRGLNSRSTFARSRGTRSGKCGPTRH